jgi:hypothetical protein
MVGFVIYHEKLGDSPSTLVWSDDRFFRIPTDSYARFPKPLTPVVFETVFSPGKVFNKLKLKTYHATFTRLWDPSDRDFSTTSPVTGHFEKNGFKQVSFVWNPENLLSHPVRCNFTPAFDVIFHTEVCVQISVIPPVPPQEVPSPFVDMIFTVGRQAFENEVDEPLDGILPDVFLQEVSTHSLFNIHFAVGLPDNIQVPTLNFSDFCYLANRPPSWDGVEGKIGEKYVKLAKDETNTLAATFLNRLNSQKGSKTSSKNILLYPGRWENFTLRDAFVLGQEILKKSIFGVYISVIGHPLTTLQNAHELNPHLCGNSSFAEVEARHLFTTPIGISLWG